MKIYIDGTVLELPATGIGKSLLELYKKCIEINPSLEITVLHRKPLKSILPQGMISQQIGFNLTDKGGINEILWRYITLPWHIYKNKPQFVHFPWNGNVPPLFSNSTKVLLTINDVLPLAIPNYFKSDSDKDKYLKKLQTSINRADNIFTISEYSKQEILSNFEVGVDVDVIYLASTAKNKYSDAEFFNFKYFLYVGGYDPRKGLEILLEIFIKLHKENKLHNKLVLTGSKNYFSSSFKSLVAEGVKQKIVVEKGYVTEEELSSLYSNATALVYPSKYEGFGLPPMEAMSMGCPVITTEYTSLPEICKNAAYYIDVDNEANFAQALIELETDESLQEKLRKKGKKRASQFSWDSTAKKFLNKLMDLNK